MERTMRSQLLLSFALTVASVAGLAGMAATFDRSEIPTFRVGSELPAGPHG